MSEASSWGGESYPVDRPVEFVFSGGSGESYEIMRQHCALQRYEAADGLYDHVLVTLKDGVAVMWPEGEAGKQWLDQLEEAGFKTNYEPAASEETINMLLGVALPNVMNGEIPAS